VRSYVLGGDQLSVKMLFLQLAIQESFFDAILAMACGTHILPVSLGMSAVINTKKPAFSFVTIHVAA